jgi:hypothetical protein
VTFPFAHLVPTYPGTLSDQYAAGLELVGGAVTVVPLLALALAAPVLLVRARRSRPEDLVLATLLLAGALLVMAVPLLTFNGATMRYEVDWVTMMMLAALIVWLRVAGAIEGRRPIAVPVRAVALLAAAATAFFGLAFSMTGYGDTLRNQHYPIYERIRDAFGFVPTIASHLRGEPVLIDAQPNVTPTDETVVTIAAPGAGDVDLTGLFDWNPALLAGSRVRLRVAGSDGVVRAYPLTSRRLTVRAGVGGGGLQRISIRWILVRGVTAPGQPPPAQAGYSVSGIRVAAWNAR